MWHLLPAKSAKGFSRKYALSHTNERDKILMLQVWTQSVNSIIITMTGTSSLWHLISVCRFCPHQWNVQQVQELYHQWGHRTGFGFHHRSWIWAQVRLMQTLTNPHCFLGCIWLHVLHRCKAAFLCTNIWEWIHSVELLKWKCVNN